MSFSGIVAPKVPIIKEIKEMKLQSSYIYLRDVRFHAYHGVMPQETAVGADFIVNIRVGYDIGPSMQTDDVTDTLSYADIYNAVRREMDVPSRLLEHVAGRIAKTLSDTWPEIKTLDMTITKTNPPMGAECGGAGIEIHLINDKTV